jgi:hypothetical protein
MYIWTVLEIDSCFQRQHIWQKAPLNQSRQKAGREKSLFMGDYVESVRLKRVGIGLTFSLQKKKNADRYCNLASANLSA